MEEEIKNLTKVWLPAITSLTYCHLITSRIPKGFPRLISLLPIFYLFITLPLALSSSHLTGVTSFFLTWLANFKLLLFAFHQGPLSETNKLQHFILVASLPIKITQLPHKSKNNTNPSPQIPHPTQEPHQGSSFLKLAIKIALLVMLLLVYDYRQYLHPHLVLVLYCCHLYLELEIILALAAIPAHIFGFEIEPQSNEPYLATSLQDFWGRRWNLMVSSILRPTVYIPVQRISSCVIGIRWGRLLGVVATFVVSGLMHELIYYHVIRVPPTWEVTQFFVLHGGCVAVEILAKEALADRWQLPPLVSRVCTVAFVVVTGIWLFFPQPLRSNTVEKAVGELLALVDYIKRVIGKR
ncbi:LOW QUALITY PROTEIN: probable long-chain-alcohol O-fatty-acyltransferase 5 [Mangifera indica]|uniref:LOW QUALITY PROTEIN: probable long-chain-alcohol O-fatty-acyltransferase 5 n=1 Tax=Mangifera indica TaxID=29780 RepID=UPI001CF9B13D|nr:LOW QUALITY PROTEIN: probable long-chain-alcohol O-fatty-acyltransferase 5 [Mangifera indica]